MIATLLRMPAVLNLRFSSDALRRWLAAGSAALVLALTIFAASPSAHHLLHDDDHQHAVAEDGCAVVMFAGGVSLPVAPLSITPPTTVTQSLTPIQAADALLISPRYLRQPERGPPVSQVS